MLFLSADVVGSTAFKNQHHSYEDYNKHWARVYEAFFNDFPELFDGNRDLYGEKMHKPVLKPPVWKCLGDEIVYATKVENSEQIYLLAQAFYKTVFEYDEQVFSKFKLRVKGTGWTAG